MANPVVRPVPGIETILGNPAGRYSGLVPLDVLQWRTVDTRHKLYPPIGKITDQVVLIAGGIEIPFALGRVWMLRLSDGYKAWEGWSDVAGNYTATGLELGVKYIPVAIDAYGNQKATAAGPIAATLSGLQAP